MTTRKLRFGVGGFPQAFTRRDDARDRRNIFAWLRSIGLNAIELQMTYGPRMPMKTAHDYRQYAEDHDIKLSIHGSYYIVLASPDPDKSARSMDTLMRTYELADTLDAREIVLHPGSLYGLEENEAAARFIDGAGEFMHRLGKSNTILMVETAGKCGQMGTVDAILDIARQVDGIGPCIDFGHVHARSIGGLATQNAIDTLFKQIDDFLTKNPDKRPHFHFTPIHYGPRGEIQHRALDSLSEAGALYHPRPEPIAAGLRQLNGDFTIISETLNSQEQGAIALRDIV